MLKVKQLITLKKARNGCVDRQADRTCMAGVVDLSDG